MSIGIIFDLIVIAIIVLFAWLGSKKGLSGLIYGIVAFLISIIISFVLYIPIANYVIDNTTLDDNLEKIIEMRLLNKKENENSNETKVTKNEMNNTSNIIVDYANKYAEDVKNNSVSLISTNIAQSIVRTMVLVILYLLSRIILVALKGLFKFLSKLPFVEQFDKLGGIIIGTIKALLIIYVVLAIISLVAPLKENSTFMLGLNKSYIGNFMYNNNILLKVVLK